MTQEPEKIEAPQPPVRNARVGRGHFATALGIVISIVLLLAILTGAFLWRLKTAPIDLSFARSYVEEALSDPKVGVFTTTSGLMLYMPDFGKPLLIGLKDVKLSGKDHEVILGVDEAAISLSIHRLLIGQIAPRQLILKKPFLRVVRTEDNGFQFGVGMVPKDDEAKNQSMIMEDILKYVARPGDQTNNSPLASLRSFEIEDARVLVEDHALGVSWFLPRFDASLESTRQGLNAALQLGLPDLDGKESFVRTSLSYDWNTQMIAANADIHNVDLNALAGKIPGLADLQNQRVVMDGTIEGLFNQNFQPQSAKIDLSSLNGALVIPGVYNKPLSYEGISLQAAYDGTAQKLDITKAQIVAQGVTIDSKGSLVRKGAAVDGPLQLEILNLPQEKIDLLWPDALRGDPSEEWIVHNITGGLYKTANASMKLHMLQAIDGSWSVDAKDVQAGFSFEGMKVEYRPPLLPVTEAKGRGTFDYDKEHLKVAVDSGKIGDLVVTNGKVELTNIIAVGKGVAHVTAKIDGPAKTLLEYGSKDPINLADKIDFDIKQVKGNADLNVDLSLPTVENVQMSDVKLDIHGTLADVFVPDIIKTLPLTGGPLEMSITNEVARITGKALIDGTPVDAQWMQYLESAGKPYAGQIKASLIADSAMRQKLGVNLDSFLEGAVPVDVVYTSFADNHAEADITAQLAPVRFFAEPFNYEKVVGSEGSATMKAVFQNGDITAIKDLNAKAPNFTAENGALTFKGTGATTALSSGQFSRFTVGETDAGLTFEITPTGQLKIALKGKFLDMRPFLANNDNNNEKPYKDPPLAASVEVEQMRTSNTSIIRQSKMYIDVDAQGHFNQLEMDAKAGAGDIYLRYKPDASGKRTFNLEAGDAGATLKAFDVYDKIVGGKLTIYAEPISSVYDRNLVGSAEITNFKVVKAPSLAHLLSVMSLTGVIDLMNDEGLSFSKLQANFDWLYRPQGSVLVLKDGRTSGNSLGLTFDGKFDNSTDAFDVQGTIIPLSGINEIIGSIPLVGDILTGGTGSLFAATYTVKGDAKKPDISVNPLSVLAPGILRRILFE